MERGLQRQYCPPEGLMSSYVGPECCGSLQPTAVFHHFNSPLQHSSYAEADRRRREKWARQENVTTAAGFRKGVSSKWCMTLTVVPEVKTQNRKETVLEKPFRNCFGNTVLFAAKYFCYVILYHVIYRSAAANDVNKFPFFWYLLTFSFFVNGNGYCHFYVWPTFGPLSWSFYFFKCNVAHRRDVLLFLRTIEHLYYTNSPQ